MTTHNPDIKVIQSSVLAESESYRTVLLVFSDGTHTVVSIDKALLQKD